MPERSVAEQLDQAVEKVLASRHGGTAPAGGKVAALARLAVDLRELPRPGFKARLKTDLERKAAMTTVAVQPVREGFHTDRKSVV